jgi:hypothetical protein
MKAEFYLDCYSWEPDDCSGFPSMTYGPAPLGAINELQAWISSFFKRTRIVQETNGQSPLPWERWPERKIA